MDSLGNVNSPIMSESDLHERSQIITNLKNEITGIRQEVKGISDRIKSFWEVLREEASEDPDENYVNELDFDVKRFFSTVIPLKTKKIKREIENLEYVYFDESVFSLKSKFDKLVHWCNDVKETSLNAMSSFLCFYFAPEEFDALLAQRH